jgi:hemolysin III
MENKTENSQTLERSNVEIANALTHFFGVLLAIPAGWIIISKGFAINTITGISMLIFTLGIVILYFSSGIYHWTVAPRAKYVLRRFDHANIYVLIAASYTPIWLCTVGGSFGTTFCIIVWSLALIGIIGELITLGKYPKLSLALYLLMGWSVVFVIKPIWENLTSTQLIFLLFEGLSYTIGTYFYAHKEKPYNHVVWHIFVLGGTIFHYFVVLPIVL